MAEIDQLVLLQLQNVGVQLDPSIRSISQLDASMVYQATKRYCELINPEAVEGLPATFPTGMSSRFKSCSAVATAIMGAGYNGEVTFNQLMYPNPTDIRKILNWLGQAAPSQDRGAAVPVPVAATSTMADTMAAIWDSLATKAKAWERGRKEWMQANKTTWPAPGGVYPRHSAPVKRRPGVIHPFVNPQSEQEAEWCRENVPYLAHQTTSRTDLLADILQYNGAAVAKDRQEEYEWSAKGCRSGLSKKEYKRKRREKVQADFIATAAATSRYDSKFAKSKKLLNPEAVEEASTVLSEGARGGTAPKSRFMKGKEYNTEEITPDEERALADVETQQEMKKRKREEEQRRLRAQMKEIAASMEKLDSEMQHIVSSTERLQQSAATEMDKVREVAEEGDKLEAKYAKWQRCLDLCNDPEGEATLQRELEEATSLLKQLQDEWDAKVAKMQAKCDALTQAISGANSKQQELLEKITKNKLKYKEFKAAAGAKEEMKAALEVELATCPKDIDRDYYLQRIMDIVKNIRKQQAEVDKINASTQETVSSIAKLHETLNRTFAMADEKCYQGVRQEVNSHDKQIYRQVIALRESFDALIQSVEEEGKVSERANEYDEKIDAMKTRNDALNIDQVNKDLEGIRKDNEELQVQVKALREQLKTIVAAS